MQLLRQKSSAWTKWVLLTCTRTSGPVGNGAAKAHELYDQGVKGFEVFLEDWKLPPVTDKETPGEEPSSFLLVLLRANLYTAESLSLNAVILKVHVIWSQKYLIRPEYAGSSLRSTGCWPCTSVNHTAFSGLTDTPLADGNFPWLQRMSTVVPLTAQILVWVHLTPPALWAAETEHQPRLEQDRHTAKRWSDLDDASGGIKIGLIW